VESKRKTINNLVYYIGVGVVLKAKFKKHKA